MSNFKIEFKENKKTYLCIAGVILLLLLAALLLLFNKNHSLQAIPAMVASVYFDGEYRIGDGEWQVIEKGEHIPSTKGDVTLRGNFHLRAPDGTYIGIYRGDIPIVFYIDHISLTFFEAGQDPYLLDAENPIYGASACGVNWETYLLRSGSNETVEILIHNPHRLGNENAIDQMLSKTALWTGIEYRNSVANSGESQRNAGMMLILASVVFLGIALFLSLIHIKSNKIIWLFGLVILFAGVYIVYSSVGVSFWSDSVIINTTVLGCSMIFYMLFLSISIVYFLKVAKRVGELTVALLAAANAVFLLLPIFGDIFFYDVQLFWVITQLVANCVLLICLVVELKKAEKGQRLLFIGALLPLIGFGVDVVGTWLGTWQGGVASEYVFLALLVAAMIAVLKLIPQSINAAAKAKELEMEKVVVEAALADSRISTMISQIRPHFIYNTLGSIEQLCKLDPQKAGDLVHSFAKYLRGNFGELDNPKPILMSQEMEHVRHYVSIERVRFPDMSFSFEMNSADFRIPALTVQPIVENAIKHGLMKLTKGGAIHVACYETASEHCICVVDDGVGFDTSVLIDERKHLGLRNIRERLRVMVNGKLEIESTVGAGTRVLITIPKEDVI